MNRIFKNISYFLLAGLLSCAAPQQSEYSMETAEKAFDKESAVPVNLQQELQRDKLEEYNLVAFEVRAIEKIKDLADYMEIISNRGYDESFRLQARKMALNSFVSPSSPILLTMEEDNLHFQADSLFNWLFTRTTTDSLQVSIDEVVTLQPFIIQEDSSYLSTLQFNLTASGVEEMEIHSRNKADVVLKKSRKKFGHKEKEIWEVYISRIY